ncbi:MAG TPA: OB-fold nucleic acid binding domain-containing protein [Terriglobales bacterium]|nr:OB-fold nucleic acid binding domain-containing protein [Terriglobales bacterium]
MRFALQLAFAVALLTGSASGKCIPVEQAPDKIGTETCVAGTVVRVTQGKSGTWFVTFCEDYTKCPFAVVVFPRDLRRMGDVRQLQGRTIEIFGKIKSYKGQAEIILKDSRQLRGEAAKLPPPPSTYDASRKGRYSAGRFRSSPPKQTTAKSERSSAELTPDKPASGEGDAQSNERPD